MRTGLVLLAVALGVAALGSASAQAPATTVAWADKLPGTWYGTCTQIAASNAAGTEAMCLPNRGKTKMRYRITFTYTNETYMFNNSAGSVMYHGKKYGYAGFGSPSGNYSITASEDGSACTHVAFEDGSTAAFLSYVFQLGSGWWYVEEGIYSFDNIPKDVCPWYIGMGQRCVRSRQYYTYSCTARKIA